MTLLDFELHMRPSKVSKARDMYLKGQVTELHAASVMWVAKMKIGLYRVQVGVNDLQISRSSCNCDARRTRFCEHSVAVLFAIRKELGLKPILASTIPQLPCTDTRLADLLRSFNAVGHEITKADVSTFTSTAKQMLRITEEAFKEKKYNQVASIGVSIITALQEMEIYLQYDYPECERYTEPVFELLEKLYARAITEDLQAALFHDTRIEAVRRYQTASVSRKNWLALLLAGANNDSRKDQFIRTLNALCILVRGSESEYSQENYVKTFLYYKDKLA